MSSGPPRLGPVVPAGPDPWPGIHPGLAAGGLRASRGVPLAGCFRLSAAGCPGAVAVGDPEHAEAGQVDCGSEQGPAAAVAAAHQVGELAFDLGPGGPVAGFPVRVALTGPGQLLLTGAGVDAPPLLGLGAAGSWRRRRRRRPAARRTPGR